jgi:hypothetical protein
MKGTEKRMKAQTTMFGRMVKCYNLPLDEVADLNTKYETAKEKLNSFGHRLAGRLESELEFTQLLQSTNIFKKITDCMLDYVDTCENVNLTNNNFVIGVKNLNILSCWINDMKEGEYNPPHTHHDLTGWSTVLFLKVPEFKNDEVQEHKFKDGQLGFIEPNGVGTVWMKPKLGDFYIFEARHQHCVMPFKTKIKGKIRRSMSFNFINNIASENSVS